MHTLTVDEVAAETGLSVRTVRFYQSEGLLPAPARVGREARYGPEHVERIGVISRLQEQGLRLSAIAELLRRQGPDGPAAAEWLGLTESLTKPWSEDRAALLSESELRERIGPAAGGDIVEGLERTGVIERRADASPVVYLVPSPGLLDIAVALVAVGLDLDTAAGLRALLQERLSGLAADLVARFTDEVSLSLLNDRGPEDLASLLDQLRPLTRRAVDLLFAAEMERAQRQLLAAVDPTESHDATSERS